MKYTCGNYKPYYIFHFIFLSISYKMDFYCERVDKNIL